jgi:hypothetical protein
MDSMCLEQKREKKKKYDHLQKLNEEFENLKSKTGVSNTKISKVIKSMGYCLTDCVKYGPNLKWTLRKNPHLRIGRQVAKRYQYVKYCLINLN